MANSNPQQNNVLAAVPSSLLVLVLWLVSGVCAICTAVAGVLMLIPQSLIQQVNKASQNSTFDYKKQVVIITGGSNGVGELTVKKFMDLGSKVAVLDIHEPSYKLKDNVKYYHCDVSNSSMVKAVIDKVAKELGPPTVLFNNAGIVVAKSLISSTIEELDRVNNVTYASMMYTTHAVLPYMLEKNNGHIISVASMVSFVTTPKSLTYCAAKAAVHSFFEGLRQELDLNPQGDNIHVSTVYPARIKTNMFSGVKTPQWFVPDVTPDYVAQQVVDTVGSQQGKDLFLPLSTKLLQLIVFFPRNIRNIAYQLTGVATSFDGFKGNKW
ncbi:hypothetical protein BB559_006927 [Furculomyces boomerangus]|uniref:Uncharacterized protein n=1 Tax=Furculomyces boomerangus TaxID=61424 RepID=A0A2T9XZU7_9FUNG|nr:hypothetical protein BB559_006927 [Furculomyces boomerangus]